MNKLYHYFTFEFLDEISTPPRKFSLQIELLNEKTSISYRWGLIFSFISGKNTEKCFKAFEDNHETKTPSLLKIYQFSNDFSQRISSICKEIFLLKYLEERKMQNFSKLRSLLFLEDSFQIPNAIILYLEYQDFSLREILRFRRENKFFYKENELLAAMKQILCIFKTFYDECSLVHRDIKPENIFFSSKSNSYMISDFSESKFMLNPQKEVLKGTPFYLTPENYEAYISKEFKNKSNSLIQNDIYALGVVFFLMKKMPALEETSIESFKIMKKFLENDASLSAKIILNMLEENLDSRPSYFSLYSKFSRINDEKNPEVAIYGKLTEYLKNYKDENKEAEGSLNLGLALMLTNQLDKAAEELKKAKEFFNSLKDEPKKAVTMLNLGKIYYKLDLLEKAAAEIEPILEQIKRIYSEIDENVSVGLEIMAKFYEKKGRFIDSVMRYEENIINIEKRCGNFDLKIAEINENLGDIYENLKQNEEACKRWNEAVGIFKHHNSEKKYENHINKINDKIYKFHPSEIYEEIEESSSSIEKKNSADKNENLFESANENDESFKKNSEIFVKEIKLIPNSNELKVPKADKIEKTRKASVFSEQHVEKNDEIKKKVHTVEMEETFKEQLLKINCEFFPHNLKNTIRFIQNEEDFKRNCLKKENSLVFQNEFLMIKSTETVFRRNYSNEYDLILEIFYENRSKINKIQNIYVKFAADLQGVFLNVQQLKATELETEKPVHHSIFVKFKALKYEMPVIFFFGKYNKYFSSYN